jgi:Protein of unknown function (DUF2004)
MKLTHFGDIDPAALEERYDVDIQLDGRPIKLDLNFEPLALTEATAKAINAFLADLASHVTKAKLFVAKDLDNKKDATVKDFIAFHVEELPPNSLAKLLDLKSTMSKAKQLVGKLVVERVGIYPHARGDGFAIFDHTFEGNKMVKGRRAITDQIIAVYLDAKGKIGHLSHES